MKAPFSMNCLRANLSHVCAGWRENKWDTFNRKTRPWTDTFLPFLVVWLRSEKLAAVSAEGINIVYFKGLPTTIADVIFYSFVCFTKETTNSVNCQILTHPLSTVRLLKYALLSLPFRIIISYLKFLATSRFHLHSIHREVKILPQQACNKTQKKTVSWHI